MALQTKSLTTATDIIRFFLRKWSKNAENHPSVVKYGLAAVSVIAHAKIGDKKMTALGMATGKCLFMAGSVDYIRKLDKTARTC